ncbi:Guanyl-specific ribonuclease Po1, partial [Leucoagaricus sp. SymC.cos]
YTHEDVMAGIAQGNETNSNPTSGRGRYPHRFGNREGIEMPFCDSKQFIEFPLKQGEPYTDGPPGADRVIYSVENEFCGCITHCGAKRKSGFVSCTYDDP